MTFDITKRSLHQKRALVMRVASQFHDALVPMDDPALSKELARYVQSSDDAQNASGEADDVRR